MQGGTEGEVIESCDIMITAIVLAAGKSERMGGVKAVLPYKNTTFIENILDNIKNSGVSGIFVVLGFNREKIEPFLKNTKITINPCPEEGQFSSLKIGIANLPKDAEAALVHLVDVPAVMPETYKAVIAAYKNNPEKIIIPYYNVERGAPCTVPKTLVHGHPVIFPKKFFNSLLDYPLSKTARDFIHEQSKDNILNLEVNDPAILKDFDTRQDLCNQ